MGLLRDFSIIYCLIESSSNRKVYVNVRIEKFANHFSYFSDLAKEKRTNFLEAEGEGEGSCARKE